MCCGQSCNPFPKPKSWRVISKVPQKLFLLSFLKSFFPQKGFFYQELVRESCVRAYFRCISDDPWTSSFNPNYIKKNFKIYSRVSPIGHATLHPGSAYARLAWPTDPSMTSRISKPSSILLAC